MGRPLRILMRYHFMAAYDAIIDRTSTTSTFPAGRTSTRETSPRPSCGSSQPIVAAPLASFSHPAAGLGLVTIGSGPASSASNLDPHRQLQRPQGRSTRTTAGPPWGTRPTTIESDIQITARRARQRELPDDPKKPQDGGRPQDQAPALRRAPRRGLTLDSLVPFVDHPVVAVRSPSRRRSSARQVYRISVMVKMANLAPAPGAGGLIVRDSIGGERLQFRARDMGASARVGTKAVYYRWVPADGTLSVTLGMAGYNYCGFDDLKVEPIVETVEVDTSPVAVRARRRTPRPSTPDPTETSATGGAPPARPATANRLRPYPVRE